MFEDCKRFARVQCPFCIIEDGEVYCGMANSAIDPTGESKVKNFKSCPLEKNKGGKNGNIIKKRNH